MKHTLKFVYLLLIFFNIFLIDEIPRNKTDFTSGTSSDSPSFFSSAFSSTFSCRKVPRDPNENKLVKEG